MFKIDLFVYYPSVALCVLHMSHQYCELVDLRLQHRYYDAVMISKISAFTQTYAQKKLYTHKITSHGTL